MSLNTVNKETGELITTANGTRIWCGTKTAHDLAVQQGTMPNNCMVCITDDYYTGREQFSGSIGSISGTSITTLKSITLAKGKTICGTMTCNLGAAVNNTVLNLWARTTEASTVDSSEVVVSSANTTAYSQVTCPFCITNNTDSDMTVRLGHYQGQNIYSADVRATYTIF